MSTSQLERWQRYVVITHIALAVLYGVIIPPYEAHDETGHYAYVNHVVTTFSLPDARTDANVFLDQSHQPPLYYLIAAGLTFWVDRSDQLSPQINLFAFDGTNRRGTRILLRDPGETFPWHGTILAIHAARLVSALLSGCMIWLIGLTATRLFKTTPIIALLTTAIAAFNPQVLFMAAMVNNDVMVSLMGAALLYGIVRFALDDEHTQTLITPRALLGYAVIGVTLALALWSKNSSLILLPFTATALVIIAWRQHWSLPSLLVRGVVTLVVTVLVASPLYLSNYLRYDQWIVDRAAQSPIITAPASVFGEGLAVSVRDGWLPQIFINAFRTFWGAFGWGNVQMPDAVYLGLFVITLVGIAGCVLAARKSSHTERTALLLLGLLGTAMLLLPGYRAIYYQSPALLPGRYLMPALIAYAGLISFGWVMLLRRWPISSFALGGTFAVLAIAVPLSIIQPAYALPAIQKTDGTLALLTFEDAAQVTYANAETVVLQDREGMRQYAHVQLTWRALKSSSANYAFGISVLGRNAEVLGNLNIQPAGGNYPSSNWHTGDTFTDDYYVLLEKPCPALPAQGRVSVGVYEYQQVRGDGLGISITHQLEARDGDNRPVAPIVGNFRIEAPVNPLPVFWQPARAMLSGIALRGVEMDKQVTAGTTVKIGLTYETWQSNNPNGIGFVHVFDASGKRIAQDDHAPAGGAYPTNMWIAGECVRETYSLDIPATATGNLMVLTGFYAPADGARFETGTQDNLVPLGEIKVIP